jgi:hypothetical protein
MMSEDAYENFPTGRSSYAGSGLAKKIRGAAAKDRGTDIERWSHPVTDRLGLGSVLRAGDEPTQDQLARQSILPDTEKDKLICNNIGWYDQT